MALKSSTSLPFAPYKLRHHKNSNNTSKLVSRPQDSSCSFTTSPSSCSKFPNQISKHPWPPRLRNVAVYYHFAISTFPVEIVIRSSAFILEYLLQLPIRVMSSPNHLTSDIKDAFSSNFLDYTPTSPDYFPTSSGNISPDPPDNLSKYLLASLAISPFHDMQEYNAVANKPPIPPQDPISLPAILTLSPILPLSLLFDP
ncbi:hypothetical protein Tco_0833111 [Tanacetum coccineum]